MEAAKAAINKPVHLVIGGTHLLPAKDDEIVRIANALRDEWKVEFIAPAHCTGEAAFAVLKRVFGDHYVYAGLGTTIVLGPTVKTLADAEQPRMEAMDETDLRSYRTLLVQNDGSETRTLEQIEPEPRGLAADQSH